ncbi:MAG: DUF3516 domain-containing protein [Actinomycetia bacterium]|nr:DUF3516 domain-containing protein [Actinomycetes bacterium]
MTDLRLLPNDPEGALDQFLAWAEEQGIELYPAQEEAILETAAGNHVILNTPTGSGKSLVALAAHWLALDSGGRTFYTAPIKALVSEKFFALCRDLGSDRVGMITGDASVNADAPVICCTAEILANMALRHGTDAPVDQVIMDEFHYYADPDRGWAWQVPLLELPDVQFLLLSATLGDTRFLADDLETRTGRPVAVVRSAERPVPLDFEYRHTPLHTSIEELLQSGRAPIYLVHFTQKTAAEAAQRFTSIDILTKAEKEAVKEAIGGFRFDSPIGTDLRRWVHHGIGIHHAGLLPKYRLLVEKLAQAGHLKLIAGTDTLGVGVNIPIRSVLFTQLCKYDGRTTRTLSVREFQQIAGRAGRAGFDTEGTVWVQAPQHVVENLQADAKAAADPKKKRKLVKKKPPDRGYSHWNEKTLEKLADGTPETLTSNFGVSHSMLLNLLDRPGDGCAATRHLLTNNHEPRPRQRRHIRRAISIYRSLVQAEVVEQLDEPDDLGRPVRIDLDLQVDFSLNQPLSPFVIEAVDLFDPNHPEYALDVLSLVEAVLENPFVVLLAQLDKLKTDTVNRLKSEGVEFEQRMEELDKLEWPKPNRELIYGAFDAFAAHHPWVGTDNIQPKSVVRDMHERAMTFREYINHYGLKRSEGLLLRYLSDAYKALIQTVPESAKTDELDDITEWLGVTVRQVDSSLIDEWERLRDPDPDTELGAATLADESEREDVTGNTRAFRVMVRNELFRWVLALARRSYGELAEVEDSEGERWTIERVIDAITDYRDEYEHIGIDGEARGPDLFIWQPGQGRARQILADPDEHHEWGLDASVDWDASREAGRAVLRLEDIRRE